MKLLKTSLIFTCIVFPLTCYGEPSVSTKYIVYEDNNQVTVKTNTLDLSFDAGHGVNVSVGAVVDGITAASRKIPLLDGLMVDGVTSATPRPGSTEYRREYSAGAGIKMGETTAKVTLDNSKEDDYASSAYFLSITHEINNRNTALSFSYSDFDDTVSPYGVTWTDKALSKVYDFSLTRVLTPVSQIRFNSSYSLSDGYLENPYHRVGVVLDSHNVFYYKETHPTIRDKFAFGIFYNLGVPGEHRSSWQLNYRYYSDNWKVKSNTYEAKYNRYLNEKLWVSLLGRFYDQTQAFFFKNFYTQEERFMTSDLKLAPFTSNLYGLGLNYALTSWIDLELSYQQYNQKTNLDYMPFIESIAKSDLGSNLLFVGTSLKF